MSNQIAATHLNTTVIICCAGMGTRLGIGSTKAAVDICGEPLIIRQLKLLSDYPDVRIVVGYQAEKLIRIVTEYRKDVIFAFNYDYENTGVADSMRKALLGAKEYVMILDGDTLMHPEGFKTFVECKKECLVLTDLMSEVPIKAVISEDHVVQLSRNVGTLQWPGMAKIRREKLTNPSPHVYDVLNSVMPLDYCMVRVREIDTEEDYEQAILWFENDYQ